jgi:2-dehydro-3-deoxygalactonokinase
VETGVVLGDWGNSRLRLWRMRGAAVAERRDGSGMSGAGDPRAALDALLHGWEAERVSLCGMAGARNGLHEAPYVRCPATLADWAGQAARIALDGRTLTLAAGIADGERPDVMRGEETQVFGALALDPELSDGRRLFLLPGTHSKWVEVADRRITGLRTYLTGELFELLSRSSLFTVAPGDAGTDDEGFAAGLARSAEGADITAALFEARAGQLLDGKSCAWARGFVSGLLIGVEVRAHARSGAGAVVMIGEPELTALYGQALECFGLSATALDGEACAIAGLGLLDACG